MRRKTLRKLPPETRKVARLIGEMESATRRLKNLLPEIQMMEMWKRSEEKRQKVYGTQEDQR